MGKAGDRDFGTKKTKKMTREDFLEKKRRINARQKDAIRNLESEYAKANSGGQVGDIVKDEKGSIEVVRILGATFPGQLFPTACFWGFVLDGNGRRATGDRMRNIYRHQVIDWFSADGKK